MSKATELNAAESVDVDIHSLVGCNQSVAAEIS